MTWALICLETVHHRPRMMREIKTWLSDRGVGNSSTTDATTRNVLTDKRVQFKLTDLKDTLFIIVDVSHSPQLMSLEKDDQKASVQCRSSGNLPKTSYSYLSMPSRHCRQSSADGAGIFQHHR